MIRRTTAIIALLAFTNYILGCYSNENITTSEATQTKERIVQIVLKDGSIVKFDDVGGAYVLKKPGLIGKKTGGTPFYCPISKVVYVYSTKSMLTTKDSLAGRRIVEVLHNKVKMFFDKEGGKYDSERQVIAGRTIEATEIALPISNVTEIYSVGTPPVSKEEYMQNPHQFVAEIMITSGKVSEIDDNGATFVGERGVIVGTMSTGQFVEIDVNEIADAQVSKTDVGLTILATIGVISVIVIIFGIIVLKNTSFVK